MESLMEGTQIWTHHATSRCRRAVERCALALSMPLPLSPQACSSSQFAQLLFASNCCKCM